MKYIIEIENNPMIAASIDQEIDELWKVKGFKSLVFDKTGLNKLTPYKEKDNNLNEIWNFAREIINMNYDDFITCFKGMTKEDVFEMTYQEVKTMYDVWEAETLHIGDEVTITNGATTCVIYGFSSGGSSANLIYPNGQIGQYPVSRCKKTGKKYDMVVKLLEKMGE